MKFIMRLFQQRGIYYVEINGKRRSLGTRDKAEARRAYAEVKKEALAGKLAHLTGKCRVTLGQFRDEYIKWAESVQTHSTFRANRLALDKLIYHTGEKISLDRISPKHIDKMVSESRRSGLSTASINNYIRHSKVVLNKAKEWRYVTENPLKDCKEIRLDKKPPAFLDQRQASQFIASIKDVDLRRIVVAYLATGRRRSELLNLTWEDVDFERKQYKIIGKGSRTQWHPISGLFMAVLESISGDSGRVFSRWQHPDTLSHLIKQSLEHSGFGLLHLHHLRHSFASIQLMSGRTIYEVKELLGHTSLTATQIYSHLTDDHLREASEINLGPVDLQGDK